MSKPKVPLTVFRYAAYSLLIIVLYALQGAPALVPEISGGAPFLLVALAPCIASCENPSASIVFGAVCGALTDISLWGGIGFFAFALTLSCCFGSVLFGSRFVPSFFTAAVFSLAVSTGTVMLYFLLFVLLPDADAGVFVFRYLVRSAYTFGVSLLLYPPTAFLKKNLNGKGGAA